MLVLIVVRFDARKNEICVDGAFFKFSFDFLLKFYQFLLDALINVPRIMLFRKITRVDFFIGAGCKFAFIN